MQSGYQCPANRRQSSNSQRDIKQPASRFICQDLGIGFTLLGLLNPFGTAIAALGFAALSVGADNMQTVVGLPSSFISIIQALIVLFILAGEYLGRLTIERRAPVPETGAAEGADAGQVQEVKL